MNSSKLDGWKTDGIINKGLLYYNPVSYKSLVPSVAEVNTNIPVTIRENTGMYILDFGTATPSRKMHQPPMRLKSVNLY